MDVKNTEKDTQLLFQVYIFIQHETSECFDLPSNL